MNRLEFAKEIAKRGNVTNKLAIELLDVALEVITDALVEGDSIGVTGFGRLEVRTVAPRKARNPRTGETIDIAEKKKVAFKSGSILKSAIND